MTDDAWSGSQICDEMEPMLQDGGVIVDYHSCSFFPQRWFDLVVVLRTDNTLLYDRLSARHVPNARLCLRPCLRAKRQCALTSACRRGYLPRKLQENLECEIMQVVLDDAMESYDPDIVREVPSNTVEEMERSVDGIAKWAEEWQRQHAK